jgi:hypothetical protein
LGASDLGKVAFAPKRQAWEQWYVLDFGKHVAFKSIHSPDRFLSARDDNSVSLANEPQAWEQWTPHKNSDSTWSFFSYHGTWLSSNQNGSASQVKRLDYWEQFSMETW